MRSINYIAATVALASSLAVGAQSQAEAGIVDWTLHTNIATGTFETDAATGNLLNFDISTPGGLNLTYTPANSTIGPPDTTAPSAIGNQGFSLMRTGSTTELIFDFGNLGVGGQFLSDLIIGPDYLAALLPLLPGDALGSEESSFDTDPPTDIVLSGYASGVLEVSEPATLAIFGAGLAELWLTRRRGAAAALVR
jgi:hypothetical protein